MDMINFNLQSLAKGMSGLTFEFVIPPCKDKAWNDTSKYLSEGAFNFIEGIIYRYVPMYQNYGHWGITEINQDHWILITSELLKLRKKIDSAVSLIDLKQDLFDFNFIQEEYLREMSKNFSKYKLLYAQMIIDFIAWIDNKIDEYGSIYINGI